MDAADPVACVGIRRRYLPKIPTRIPLAIFTLLRPPPPRPPRVRALRHQKSPACLACCLQNTFVLLTRQLLLSFCNTCALHPAALHCGEVDFQEDVYIEYQCTSRRRRRRRGWCSSSASGGFVDFPSVLSIRNGLLLQDISVQIVPPCTMQTLFRTCLVLPTSSQYFESINWFTLLGSFSHLSDLCLTTFSQSWVKNSVSVLI